MTLPFTRSLLPLGLLLPLLAAGPLRAQEAPPMPPPEAAPEPATAATDPAATEPAATPLPLPDAAGAETERERLRLAREEARRLAEAPPPSGSGPVPQAYPLERYSLLWERSPFLMEVTIDTGPPPEDPFKDYTLTGVVRIGDYAMASFFNKADNSNFVVTSDGKPKDPFRLVVVQASDTLSSTVVQVTDGTGRQGNITWDPQVAEQRRSSAGASAPQAPPSQAAPAASNPPPRTNPTPAAPAARPAANTPSSNSNERRPRRRVIIPRQVPTQQR